MPLDTAFASLPPFRIPAGVEKIQELHAKGPWTTKSEGELSVLFALSSNDAQLFLYDYDALELTRIKEDITGIRSYAVRNIPENKIGGTEFHRIRQEILFGLEGSVELECEDVWRKKRNFLLTQQQGVLLPPFILHTYFTKAASNSLLVLCNTLYPPENPLAHDTYSLEAFRKLQTEYKR